MVNVLYNCEWLIFEGRFRRERVKQERWEDIGPVEEESWADIDPVNTFPLRGSPLTSKIGWR